MIYKTRLVVLRSRNGVLLLDEPEQDGYFGRCADETGTAYIADGCTDGALPHADILHGISVVDVVVTAGFENEALGFVRGGRRLTPVEMQGLIHRGFVPSDTE